MVGPKLIAIVARATLGGAAAAAIALTARRSGALSRGGAWAAVVVGTVTAAAGWGWAGIVIAYFVAASAVSNWKRGVKEHRTGWVVAKGGARDAAQVLANGGVFTILALGSLLVSPQRIDPTAWHWMALGALAASAADTWATELGTLSAAPPRSILTGTAVTPGTSGGVTWLGMAGAVTGALTVALAGWVSGWGSGAALASVAAGVAGATADSLLGASVQARRWCDACECGTERTVHGCGATTRPAGGIGWVSNDVVNGAATVAGAGAALIGYVLHEIVLG